MDKTQVKVFPNFTSIPFDYLLISWVTNYLSNRGFLTCFSCCLSWIVSIDRELHSLKGLELKFGLSLQNFSTTYLQESFLMCSFVCPGFRKRLLCPDIFIHDILKLRRHLDTETYGRLPWQINAEISRQN